VLVMCAGDAVEYGTAEQVFSDPRHDYTRTLLDAVPRIDDEVAS
jgi:peptide/nickel transport system ATP-binding protein